ncbi:MAG: hypothetical protein AAGF19_07875, partial [Pseudomonadota bacterium]
LLLYTAGSVLLGAGGGARLLYWAIPAPADPVWMMLVAPGVQCLVMGVLVGSRYRAASLSALDRSAKASEG